MVTMSEMFNRYQILSSLANGTASRLYLASSPTAPEKQVVIKEFESLNLSDPQRYQPFLDEVAKLKQLSHPHILPVLDAGLEKNHPYLVYPRAENESLGDLLRRTSPLACAEAVQLLCQIGQALACAHERGIIHGNLKPENVLFNAANEVQLADFRLESLEKVQIYRLDTRSACYMAPEQFAGSFSPASDQYSLACVAYELLTGRVPFSALTGETLRTRHRQDKPMPLSLFVSDLPEYIEAAILRAMAKNPQARYASMNAFMSVLVGAAPPQAYAAPVEAPVGSEEPAFGTMASSAAPFPPANNFAPPPQQPVVLGGQPQVGSVASPPPSFTHVNNPIANRLNNPARRFALKRPDNKMKMTARGWAVLAVAGLLVLSMALVPFWLASQPSDKNVQVATATPAGMVPTDVPTDTASTDSTAQATVSATPSATPTATPTPRKATPTPTITPVPTAAPVTPANSGFESPNVGSSNKGYTSSPGGAGWQFSGKNSGIASNGSSMTANSSDAPEGSQVGFVQGHGSISQSLSMRAGTYKVKFYAAQGGFTFTSQTLQVSLDGNIVLSITLSKSSYSRYSSASFTVPAGSHTLQFAGTNSWDQSVGLVDQVSVVPA